MEGCELLKAVKKIIQMLKNNVRRRSNFFYSIFIPSILIGIILITGFGIYIYQGTYNNTQSNLITDRQSYVNQVRSNIEQKVQTVEFAFTTYSNTNSFKTITQKELNYRDYEEVREVSSELAYIGAIGIGNASYRLVSLSKGWEINNGSLNYLPSEEVKKLETLFVDSNRYIVWKPNKKSIDMYVLLPTFSTERSAIGIAKIGHHAITNLIEDSENEFLNIYNQSGDLLFANKNELLSEADHQQLIETTERTGTFVGQGGNTFVYTKSTYNQWIYVSMLAKEKAQSDLSSLAKGLIIIILLLILFFVAVTYVIANRASQPFRKIRDTLSVASHAGSRKEEINQILLGIDSIVEQNTDLSAKLNYQKPELESLFLLNLFRNRFNREEIPDKLKQFGYTVNANESYVVMLIQIDDLGGREPATQDIFLLSIENLVSEIIPVQYRFRPIVLNENTQLTILKIPKKVDKKQIIHYCEQIRQAAKQYLKIKISFGLSERYKDLTLSKFAVDTAKEALNFRIHLGSEVLVFYDDISSQLDEKSMMKYPREAERALLDAMRSANQEEVKKAYDIVMAQIWEENHNPLTIENAIFQLLTSIVQLGQLLGVEAEFLLSTRKIYAKVLNKESTLEIKELIYSSLIYPVVENIHLTTDKQMRTLSERILALLHQQYDQDISLESIADQLHYNPNYLSSVFKKEFGMSFTDYLQSYRLSIAKKWLIETDQTVKAISERLKYNNSQNFIRFFKKHVGMTPGEYRKEKGESRNS